MGRHMRGKNRNKGDGQGTFAKQPPKKIREPECHEKGIGQHSGTEKPCNYHIPDKTENTAK